MRGTTVLVMPAYRHAAHRVFNAAEMTFTAAGSTTATVAANPLGGYRVFDSRLAYRRIIASGIAAATPRSGGSSATSARRSPTWRTGRSP